jgi:hypothetical protein
MMHLLGGWHDDMIMSESHGPDQLRREISWMNGPGCFHLAVTAQSRPSVVTSRWTAKGDGQGSGLGDGQDLQDQLSAHRSRSTPSEQRSMDRLH